MIDTNYCLLFAIFKEHEYPDRAEENGYTDFLVHQGLKHAIMVV
ncbi:MAG: hypothetical protein Q8903_03570 [Bacteroidota bacterium]|nr:hypothetical protein [Bacteroidota bacterium]